MSRVQCIACVHACTVPCAPSPYNTSDKPWNAIPVPVCTDQRATRHGTTRHQTETKTNPSPATQRNPGLLFRNKDRTKSGSFCEREPACDAASWIDSVRPTEMCSTIVLLLRFVSIRLTLFLCFVLPFLHSPSADRNALHVVL